MSMSFLKSVIIFGVAVLAINVHADQVNGSRGMNMKMGGMDMDNMKMDYLTSMKYMKMGYMANVSTKAISTNVGVVQNIDKANSNITLKHGPIKSKTIEMGPMTMSFVVKSPSLLSNVKVGDKVKFVAEYINDTATVTSLIVQK